MISPVCVCVCHFQDWVYHHTLMPRLPASTTAISITDQGASSSSKGSRSRSWTLPQSDVEPGEFWLAAGLQSVAAILS